MDRLGFAPGRFAAFSGSVGRLAYDPVEPAAPRVLRVSIAPATAGFAATAELRAPTGRVLWSHTPLADVDCRTLIDNVGLSIKFAIDPAASSPGAVGAPTVSLLPVPIAPSTAPPADRPEPIPPPASSRPKFRVGVRGAGTVGTAPAPAGTISANLGVGWEHFSISGEGRLDLPATGTVATSVQLQTRIGAGSLVSCGHDGAVPQRLPEGVGQDPVDDALHEVLLHEGDLRINGFTVVRRAG